MEKNVVPDDETTFDQLRERIMLTIQLLEAVDEQKFNDAASHQTAPGTVQCDVKAWSTPVCEHC